MSCHTHVTVTNNPPEPKKQFAALSYGDWFVGSSGTVFVKTSAYCAFGIGGKYACETKLFSPQDMVLLLRSVTVHIGE